MNDNKGNEPARLLQQAFVLHRDGRLGEACRLYERVISIQPAHPNALPMLAALKYQSKDVFAALSFFNRALRVGLQPASTFFNRGLALQELGRFNDAILSYNSSVTLKPGYAEAFNNIGNIYRELTFYDKAESSYARARDAGPMIEESYNNKGNLLREVRRFEEALKNYNYALIINPGNAVSHSNLGVSAQEMRRLGIAEKCFERSTLIDPQFVDAHLNRALLFLLRGEFDRGWGLYEWRLRQDAIKSSNYDGLGVTWRGEGNIVGKRLLVHCEQGLGDSIQFVRYLPKVRDFGANVTLQVQKPLVQLFSNLGFAEQVISENSTPPVVDVRCPLLSLPYVFKTTLETIPANTPYILPDPEKVAIWRKVLGPRSRPRVGLVWSGRMDNRYHANRSVPLKTLLPLLELPVEWHSLQKGFEESDKALLDRETRICRHEENFDDTAALIQCLDLVISVDTSIAHLAGAMGKTVWVLLPFVPDFRWLLDRDYSPWYPSARLFRQDQSRNWSVVVHTVKKLLSESIRSQGADLPGDFRAD